MIKIPKLAQRLKCYFAITFLALSFGLNAEQTSHTYFIDSMAKMKSENIRAFELLSDHIRTISLVWPKTRNGKTLSNIEFMLIKNGTISLSSYLAFDELEINEERFISTSFSIEDGLEFEIYVEATYGFGPSYKDNNRVTLGDEILKFADLESGIEYQRLMASSLINQD